MAGARKRRIQQKQIDGATSASSSLQPDWTAASRPLTPGGTPALLPENVLAADLRKLLQVVLRLGQFRRDLAVQGLEGLVPVLLLRADEVRAARRRVNPFSLANQPAEARKDRLL